ncbi:hypothetical protein GCM10008090_34020 [Arenicella chitinivorans]|uniref:T6SS Phospholipase effector Tle1-like catalytic domain-containing protein n=1 Tax=Arenicella chitinivorans TaxID=1329800 RepID=A0A918VSU6_9GAMM|nr:DUF2235 domain-containing protein [Arenicella chitinivorans]GHA21233.1 hypothetical protein GCM10008090_34020 [Arenicella chitinivorans]
MQHKYTMCAFLIMMLASPLIAKSEEGSVSKYKAKRLVLCLDGTWNNPSMEKKHEDNFKIYKPTNVLKTCRAVLPVAKDGTIQITHYTTGVGGYRNYKGSWDTSVYLSDKILGGTRGAGYEKNVENALRFLHLNYQPGDEIYIFGFSRGAATARTVVRLIDWMGGIPKRRCGYWLPRLFDYYLASEGNGRFKEIDSAIEQEVILDQYDGNYRIILDKIEKENKRKVLIEDLPNWKNMDDHELDELFRTVEHESLSKLQGDAVEIEKKRNTFKSSLTRKRNLVEENTCKSESQDTMIDSSVEVKYLGLWDTVVELGSRKNKFYLSKTPPEKAKHVRHALAIDERRKNFKPWPFSDITNCTSCARLEQKWFAGVHTNVGGGYTKDGLANIALKWVHKGAKDRGLELDAKYTRFYEPYYPTDMLYDSKTLLYSLEWFQFWRSGVRSFDQELDYPNSTLDVHPSVFRRMSSCTTEYEDGRNKRKGPYRPKNLIKYLKNVKNLDQYLEEKYPVDSCDCIPEWTRSRIKQIVKGNEEGKCEVRPQCPTNKDEKRFNCFEGL